MKPLIVLIVSFGISILALKVATHKYDYPFAGRIALAAMLLFTAIGHFIFTKGMTMMIPDFIPFKTAMIYGTGIIEIVAAIGLLSPAVRILTGWLLILFFVLLLPANINASIKQLDIEHATL